MTRERGRGDGAGTCKSTSAPHQSAAHGSHRRRGPVAGAEPWPSAPAQCSLSSAAMSPRSSRRTGAHRAHSLARQAKTKRRRRDLDEIHADLEPGRAARLLRQEPDPDLPGCAQFYCLHCACVGGGSWSGRVFWGEWGRSGEREVVMGGMGSLERRCGGPDGEAGSPGEEFLGGGSWPAGKGVSAGPGLGGDLVGKEGFPVWSGVLAGEGSGSGEALPSEH